jgi:hypothetical protein
MNSLNSLNSFVTYETEYFFDDSSDEYSIFASVVVPSALVDSFENALDYSRIKYAETDDHGDTFVYEITLYLGNHPNPHSELEYCIAQKFVDKRLNEISSALSEFCIPLYY